MDDTAGDGVDPGFHRHQLRLLFLLVGAEGGDGDLAGAAQLPGRRLRSRQGLRLVFRPCTPVPPPSGCPFPCRCSRLRRLWRTVASHHLPHRSTLCTSKQQSSH
ncbi:uncharacterized protein LOC110034234, partial [Phalaenopsis equestris]|uniref:uncharacterized protein LOC110034234 n=1 Tax=Phalaenopsis equestris TaxID=78828 RepID=UPI0009E4FE12